MADELKPCPFCGGRARLIFDPISYAPDEMWIVSCDMCDATIKGFDNDKLSGDRLAEYWNTRHADDAFERIELLAAGGHLTILYDSGLADESWQICRGNKPTGDDFYGNTLEDAIEAAEK